MKHLGKVLCLIWAIAAIALFAIPYMGGRNGMPLSIGLLPAQIAPVFIGLLSFVSLVALTIVSRGKGRAIAGLALLLLISLFILFIGFSAGPSLFQAGFRHRIQATVTVDELRQIARMCHETVPIGGRLPGPAKTSLWQESEHRPMWDRLIASSALGKLDPWMTIFNDTNTVDIVWGGALVGHWGLRIRLDAKASHGGDEITYLSLE